MDTIEAILARRSIRPPAVDDATLDDGRDSPRTQVQAAKLSHARVGRRAR